MMMMKMKETHTHTNTKGKRTKGDIDIEELFKRGNWMFERNQDKEDQGKDQNIEGDVSGTSKMR